MRSVTEVPTQLAPLLSLNDWKSGRNDYCEWLNFYVRRVDKYLPNEQTHQSQSSTSKTRALLLGDDGRNTVGKEMLAKACLL